MASKTTRKRTHPEPWQREMVRKEYPTCDTKEKKEDLRRRAGLQNLRRLYHLACQEGVTRRSDVLTDAEFRAFTNGDRSVMSLRRSYTPEEEETALTQRDDPRKVKLSQENKDFIRQKFGQLDIVAIAKQCGLSESAVMYYARHLTASPGEDEEGNPLPEEPLRRPAVGFSLKRVSAWLGLSEDEVRELRTVGVQIRPLPTPKGEIVGYWVLASSLAPFLKRHGTRLVQKRGADIFFIKEILETEADLAAGKTTRTGCYFADHGHRCRNPQNGPRHGTFCPHGLDPHCKKKELRF